MPNELVDYDIEQVRDANGNGTTVVSGSTKENSNEYHTKSKEGADRETTSYSQITLPEFIEKNGLPAMTPAQKASAMRDYLNALKDAGKEPEKPEDELARAERKKKWSILGELFGGSVGLLSDVSSASQGGIVPRRATKIDTSVPDAVINKLNTDYAKRMDAYHTDLRDKIAKYGKDLDKYDDYIYKSWMQERSRPQEKVTTYGSKETGSTNKKGEKGIIRTATTRSSKSGGGGGGGARERKSNIPYTDNNGNNYNINVDTYYNNGTNYLTAAINRANIDLNTPTSAVGEDGSHMTVGEIQSLLAKIGQINNEGDLKKVEFYSTILLSTSDVKDKIFNELRKMEKSSNNSIIISDGATPAPAEREPEGVEPSEPSVTGRDANDYTDEELDEIFG